MNGDDRPDPDKLLSRLQSEAGKGSKGELRLFLGMSPGVGKTYAMLEAARQQKSSGVDVVVGLVETHSRKDTDALLEGFEIIPRAKVRYKEHEFEEFDLDAAMKRKPAIVLVDELAHTNIPGSRHEKRWQDVEALLDAGMNVWSAVNIQHLESLNDVVLRITGVRVAETVPDGIFERADEIELIDIPSEDLLARLRDGKVYVPQRAQKAMQSFFTVSNLTALRELALRTTANRVNAEVMIHRRNQDAKDIWPTTEKLLVCVGPSPTSASLVRAAKRLANGMQAPWLALFIYGVIPDNERDRAFANLLLAEELGAETHFFLGENIAEEIIAFARSHNVTKIIMGKPGRKRWRDRFFGGPLDRLLPLSGDIDIFVIRGVAERARTARPKRRKTRSWREWGLATAMIGACTGIGYAIFAYSDLANIIMVYLLGVMFAALSFGRRVSIFASFMSVLCFDFFFVPPRYTVDVADLRHIGTFGVMLAAGLILGTLTTRLRRQADNAVLLGLQNSSLAEFAGELVAARDAPSILAVARKHFSALFGHDIFMLMPTGKEHSLASVGGAGERAAFEEKEMGIAEWVFRSGKMAGKGTQTLPQSEYYFIPIQYMDAVLGVLALRAASSEANDLLAIPDKRRLLEIFVGQIAKTLEINRLERGIGPGGCDCGRVHK